MKRKLDFEYDDGYTRATLKTKYGTFIGEAWISKKDPFPPSYSIGMRIAEGRAYMALYDKRIYDKKNELKGIDRLLHSIPPTQQKAYAYARNMRCAIAQEIVEFEKERADAKVLVDEALRARNMYIRSRTTDHKAREEYFKTLGQAIEALGSVKTD